MYLVSDVDIVQEWGKEKVVSSQSQDTNTRFSVAPTLHFSFTPTNAPTRFSVVKRRTLPAGHVFNAEDNCSC
jgi:hypothetical protein